MDEKLKIHIHHYIIGEKAVSRYISRFLNNDETYKIYPRNEIEDIKIRRKEHLAWLEKLKVEAYQKMVSFAKSQGVKDDELQDGILSITQGTDEFGYWIK